MPRRPPPCTIDECGLGIDLQFEDETQLGPKGDPRHIREYHTRIAAVKTEPTYTLEFPRLESNSWRYRCVCKNTYMPVRSMIRHAEECEEVLDAVEQAIDTGADYTSPSMRVILKSKKSKDSKSTKSNATESEDEKIQSQLTLHLQRVITQTEETRTEQQHRDRRMEQYFQQQLQGQLVLGEVQQSMANVLSTLVTFHQDKEGKKMHPFSFSYYDLLVCSHYLFLQIFLLEMKSDIQTAAQERKDLKRSVQHLFDEVTLLKGSSSSAPPPGGQTGWRKFAKAVTPVKAQSNKDIRQFLSDETKKKDNIDPAHQ
ncbi:hypothetical protein BG011_002152 [Mortierella polycephala]|uniref:Uncharacterized protein n=1 Tax=Mortierella polycephala TaxID=41804 RepID=A0A9P6TUS1_9FUNG|nr:hypothetical protein BG011_002152 [Mortierella polycephala]